MNPVAIVLILLMLVGVCCVMAALSQLWAAGGGGDDPVGPTQPRSQRPAAPPVVPATFRSLIHRETSQWQQVHQWEALTQQLDRLEIEFGRNPSMPAPESFSAEWLDQRIAQIEAVAGPLPAPLRPPAPRPQRRSLWKKLPRNR